MKILALAVMVCGRHWCGRRCCGRHCQSCGRHRLWPSSSNREKTTCWFVIITR